MIEVENLCPRCNCELSFDELQKESCDFCLYGFNTATFKNLGVPCYDCGKVIEVRTEVSHLTNPIIKMCMECVSNNNQNLEV